MTLDFGSGMMPGTLGESPVSGSILSVQPAWESLYLPALPCACSLFAAPSKIKKGFWGFFFEEMELTTSISSYSDTATVYYSVTVEDCGLSMFCKFYVRRMYICKYMSGGCFGFFFSSLLS